MLLLIAATAFAHKPTFGSFADAESAHIVGDPDVSIVVYSPITCDADQLWLSFFGEAGFPLYMQLGVPVIDRLEDYRPSMALIAPGLPEPTEALPFDVPPGMGVEVFHSVDVEAPDEFSEEFTQTDSWVWIEERVTLPEDGLGYVVAWDPEGWTGKLWLATGEVEDFSDVDWSDFGSWAQEVNEFHETGEYSAVPDIEEEQCALPEETGGQAAASCAVAPRSASGLLVLLVLGLVRRRR